MASSRQLLATFLLLLLAPITMGSLLTAAANQSCTAFTDFVFQQVCCPEPNGLCVHGDTCTYLSAAPPCGVHQAVLWTNSLVASDEVCNTTFSDSTNTTTDIYWVNYVWNFTCCACPAGFTNPYFGFCNSDLDTIDDGVGCAACSDPNETLVDDPDTGYSCLMVSSASELSSASPSSLTQTTSSQSSPSSIAATSPASITTSTELSSTSSVSPNSATASCLGADSETVCDMTDTFVTTTAILGLVDTWLSTFCPITESISIAWTVLQDAEAALLEAANPTDGTLGTKHALAGAALNTIGTFLITAAVALSTPEISIAEAIGVAWDAACEVSTTVGQVLFVSNALAAKYQEYCCPSTTSKKRSTFFLGSSGDLVIPRSLFANARRDNVTYNPCQEFVNIFPANYSIFAAADSACTQMLSYNASEITEQTLANETATLQQFCAQYQNSGQSALLVDFANTLSAMQAAVPYCSNGTNLMNITVNNSTSTSVYHSTSASHSKSNTKFPSSISTSYNSFSNTVVSTTFLSSHSISVTTFTSSHTRLPTKFINMSIKFSISTSTKVSTLSTDVSAAISATPSPTSSDGRHPHQLNHCGQ